MTTLWQDAAYAVRLLRRAPAFAAVSIATLALGIAASTVIFTVVDSVLLRPLQFAEPQRLAMIGTSAGSRVSSSYAYDWRAGSSTLDDLAGWYDIRANLTGRGDPREVLADLVTPNFFALLGMPALHGRTFSVGTSESDVAAEVVLSYGFWQRQFGGSPSAIGQSMTLDGVPMTIVGVMPESFKIRTTELAESRAEVWVPFRLVPGNYVGMGGNLHVVVRLRPRVTIDQARAELSIIAQALGRKYPSYSSDWRVEIAPLLDATVREVRPALLVLFGAVGILLLIACANVANLVLSRAASREGEIAVRLSLGATSGRLVRQLMTESVVLAFVAGALAVPVAMWGTSFLVSMFPASLDLPRRGEIGVDLRVLVFASGITLLTVIVFGLLPALVAARRAPQSALRDVARGVSSGPRHNRLNSLVVVAEVALALVLLAGAGLLGRSFIEAVREDPGFRGEQVLTLRTTLPEASYKTDERIRAFGGALLERTASLPGVTAVGLANYVPQSNVGVGGEFEIEGRTPVRPDERVGTWLSVVGGRYFDAMGIPLVRGRLPGPADTERTGPVVVIDEEMARRQWPASDPIGTRVTFRPAPDETYTAEIVGVVGSVKWAAMSTERMPTTYLWFAQVPNRNITIVARVDGDPNAMANTIAAQVRSIDPNQPVADIRAMQDFVSAGVARPRFTMLVFAVFAVSALVLATIGLYGVIAFGVTQRTKELGVRVALGAQHRDVLALVMRQGLLVVGVGLAAGMAAALALGRVVSSLLYEITPRDPVTLILSALFLALVGIVATYIPARRATRVNPVIALRTF